MGAFDVATNTHTSYPYICLFETGLEMISSVNTHYPQSCEEAKAKVVIPVVQRIRVNVRSNAVSSDVVITAATELRIYNAFGRFISSIQPQILPRNSAVEMAWIRNSEVLLQTRSAV